ncbi:solute carrier family 26 protein [Fulvivirgaceae bacterium BMA12]|uniref:Solute carrier family 26 protein n=1 Tax=Agaribacillus aureus TaxID=3051825 RepID=A0ABT8LH76_9BACT|nr:solute carrier family 26 protein [Fulvivirgaceae bacterium BMA12]
MRILKKYIPLFSWLPDYNRAYLKGDISAGLTVGVMLIPQGMAYAMLAGLPPIYGLYASTVPLVLYAIFGTSRQLAVGPVAMVALLIATGVGHLAEPGTEQFIMLAVLLALMVGMMQFLLGVFRLGFLVNFLSHPVISGFTSAAALIIGLSQLKHLLGLSIPRSNYIHEILINAMADFDQIHLPTLLLGVGGIATILMMKKFSKSIPGPLVAVILGVLTVSWFGLDAQGMKIVGEVPHGLPAFSLPPIDGAHIKDLFPIALTIALVGFMESIAVAKAIQAKHKDYDVDPNQELIGLGLANIGGAFFKAFPTTGGFSRTAVNDQAGAKTGMAAIISAVLIILTLLFLTPLFYYLPNAILASVIMVAVFGLIDFKEAVYLWKTDRRDFLMMVATFVATLTFGIEQGIGVGVVLSLAMVIYRSAYPHVAVLGKMPGMAVYRNINRFPQVKERDDILIVRFDAELFFANTGYLMDILERLIMTKKDLKLIILNANAINSLDSSATHVLSDFITELRADGIDFYMSGVKGPVRDIMTKNGLMEQIGKDHFFMYVEEAVAYFDDLNSDREVQASAHATQTNLD